VQTNRPLQFQKSRQLFIGAHNEAFSIVAAGISYEDYSPVRIHG